MKNCPFINQRLCGETFAPNNYVRPNAMPPESKADAYRVYVDSWIQTYGKNVGANVYFLLGSPLERGQMPEMDSDLGTLSFDLVSHKSNSISVKLPSEDIEVIINDNKTPLTCSTEGKTLTLTLTSAPMSYETGTWPLSIRSGRVYTKATVAIEL